MNETNRIEYKIEYNSDIDIEKEVIAFLNYKEGGYVYFGIDKECDAEALRVVSSMPKWNPGQHKGEVVRTQFTIPIYYKYN